MASPYDGLTADKWAAKTKELIGKHPLKTAEIVEVILHSWKIIFDSNLGGYKIGTDLFPKPQVMGFFLHELLTLEFTKRFPGVWRGDEVATDKDLVHIPNVLFSSEVKTSSHRSQIFGNRSYAQPAVAGKKVKDGYYMAVNFEKFVNKRTVPRIMRIRFGWLDHTDWVPQASARGQQAHLTKDSDKSKLLLIYDVTTGVQAQGVPAEPIGADEPNGDADELNEENED